MAHNVLGVRTPSRRSDPCMSSNLNLFKPAPIWLAVTDVCQPFRLGHQASLGALGSRMCNFRKATPGGFSII